MSTLAQAIAANEARIAAIKTQPDSHFPLTGSAVNVEDGLLISVLLPAAHVGSLLQNGVTLSPHELQALAAHALENATQKQKDSK